jgi:hypothetical protein
VCFNARWYKRPAFPRFPAKVLITNRRLVLLDQNGNLIHEKIRFRRLQEMPKLMSPLEKWLIDYPLEPFWTLTQGANKLLHDEFTRKPGAFSKAPLQARWFVHGYREWSWVRFVHPEIVEAGPDQRSDLVFELERVRVASVWGTGQEQPTTYPEGTVRLTFWRPDEALDHWKMIVSVVAEDNAVPTDALISRVAAETPKSTGPREPFNQAHLAGLPTKPMTPGLMAYTYVVWLAFAEAIPVALLWAFRAPLWVAVPVCLVVGLLASKWVKKLRAREDSGHGFMSTKEEQLKVCTWIAVSVVVIMALPLILGILVALFQALVPATQPHPATAPNHQGVNPSKVVKAPPNVSPPTTGNVPLAAPPGSAWFGFANGTGPQDREAELTRNCGSFIRIEVPEKVGNKFSDLCAYRSRSCVRVCDWQGRSLPCSSLPMSGQRDGTRVGLCQ